MVIELYKYFVIYHFNYLYILYYHQRFSYLQLNQASATSQIKQMFLHKITITLLILYSFIYSTVSYLQLSLVRSSNKSSLAKDQCISKTAAQLAQNSQEFYDELCYFKDVAYSVQLYYSDQLYHISVDLTSPYSWLKGSGCKIVESNAQCNLIQRSFKDKIKRHKQTTQQESEEQFSDKQSQEKARVLMAQSKSKSKSMLKSKNTQTKLDLEKKSQISKVEKVSESQQQQKSIQQAPQPEKKVAVAKSHKKSKIAKIQGSNEIVQGYMQNNKPMQFWTKDSGRLSRLFDILLLGLYVLEEKEKVPLANTNYINVTKLSSNMNSLTDGALSMRFDQNSENSFLKQIFQYVQAEQKIVTIYINEKQSAITIGELSIKNSAEGFGGISWVPFNDASDDTSYGKLPLIKQVMLQSVQNQKQFSIEEDQDRNIFAVFSLSASYIGLPQKEIILLSSQLKQKYKLNCQISEHSYLQCTGASKKMPFLDENLLFQMQGGAISIPLSSLVLISGKKNVTLNLRIISKEENQKQKSFIVLGQPYFQKYFTAFDYKKDRVGFGLKRTVERNNFINTVALIRFVTTIFIFGCSFLICFRPIKAMFDAFRGNSQVYNKKSPQGRRLKYQPVQQNPYQQVSGTLRRVMQQSEYSQQK